MAGLGSGYDLSVSTFSPDGRVFQVEYACKAVDNSVSALSFSCKDGVILAVQKGKSNPMILHEKTNRRIYAVAKHVGIAISGFIADGRQLVERARNECVGYEKAFHEPMPTKLLAERMGLYMHAYTLYWSVRPFGASILICSIDFDEQLIRENNLKNNIDVPTNFGGGCGELYCVDPTGTSYKYAGQALGKGKQLMKTELEKLKLKELDCKKGLLEAARILISAQDDESTITDIEFAWICQDSHFQFDTVDPVVSKNAVQTAKQTILALQQED